MDSVENQDIRNAVCLYVIADVAAEKAQVDDMNFFKILAGKLRKGVAVRIFEQEKPAAARIAAPGNDSLCLVGIQKYSILVGAFQIFLFVNTVRFVITVVIGNRMVFMPVPRGYRLGGNRRERNLVPCRAAEITA